MLWKEREAWRNREKRGVKRRRNSWLHFRMRQMQMTAAPGRGSGWYLVEVGEDAELGAHLWYGFLKLLNPLLLLRFLFGRHSPLTLNQTDVQYLARIGSHIQEPLCSHHPTPLLSAFSSSLTQKPVPSCFLPPPLSVSSSLHTAVGGWVPLVQSGTGSPGRSETQWSGQIWPSAGSKETGQTKKNRVSGNYFFPRKIIIVCVKECVLPCCYCPAGIWRWWCQGRRRVQRWCGRDPEPAVLCSTARPRSTPAPTHTNTDTLLKLCGNDIVLLLKIRYHTVSVIHLRCHGGASRSTVNMFFLELF